MRPSIGRIVHFYDESLVGQTYKVMPNNAGMAALNGQNAGPYPAIIVQLKGDPDDPDNKKPADDKVTVNMWVLAMGGSWPEVNVMHKDHLKENLPDQTKVKQRYWVWPPREPVSE